MLPESKVFRIEYDESQNRSQSKKKKDQLTFKIEHYINFLIFHVAEM